MGPPLAHLPPGEFPPGPKLTSFLCPAPASGCGATSGLPRPPPPAFAISSWSHVSAEPFQCVPQSGETPTSLRHPGSAAEGSGAGESGARDSLSSPRDIFILPDTCTCSLGHPPPCLPPQNCSIAICHRIQCDIPAIGHREKIIVTFQGNLSFDWYIKVWWRGCPEA